MSYISLDNCLANRVQTTSDDSLISQNRKKIQSFWLDNYPILVRRARLLSRNRDQAEDLVSQATLKLLNFVETHLRPLDDAGALFFMVLRNLAIDEYRGARRAALLYDHSVDVHEEADLWRLPAARGDAHERLADGQALAAVEARLDLLPGEARALFVQRFVEHRSYREIAAHFRISEALARKRVQKLRARLADRPPPDGTGDASRLPRPRVHPRQPA